jgi:hypothetical protein
MAKRKLLNNGKIMVERDQNGRIKPGSVLNPDGKPKGTKHMSTILSGALDLSNKDGLTNQEVIIQKVIDLAKEGNMKAIELVWNRVEGKSPITIDQRIPKPIMEVDIDLTEAEKDNLRRLLTQNNAVA